MSEASFLIWKFRFFDDRIEIIRRFYFYKKMTVSTANIECVNLTSDIFLRLFKRCALTVVSGSNMYTLIGIPRDFALGLSEKFIESGAERARITVSNKDLIKKSILQSRIIPYLVLLLILWTLVAVFGFISEEFAEYIEQFALKRTVPFGVIALSLALPQALIWLWAVTGGVLIEFIRFYRYTATRSRDVICFEYGMIIHRKVYIHLKRIAMVEYSQSPVMQLFGCGQIRVCGVGYNAYFMKSSTVLPFVTNENMNRTVSVLFPEFACNHTRRPANSLFYFLNYRTTYLPFLLLAPAFFFGKSFILLFAVTEAVVILNCLLLHRNSGISRNKSITMISRGGIFKRTSLIRSCFIEAASEYGTKRKRKRGYTSLALKVFGRDARSVRVRNIPVSSVADYSIPPDEP